MSNSVFQNLKQVDRKTLTFTMNPTHVSYANTLRRSIQTEVSILGFRADMTESGSTSDVYILKNSTPMSNEMLADRIGLLPITPRPSDKEAGWELDKILFKLHVVNDTDDVRIVYASDFECLEKTETTVVGEEETRTRIPNTVFFPPDPVSGETCILAVLKPKQEGQAPEEIHLQAYASFGKGKEHTRFNPSCQASYGYTLDTNPVRINELFSKWVRTQKNTDPESLEKDEVLKGKLEREFRSLELYRCYKMDGDGEPNSFDFTVETIGQLSVQTIVYQALIAVANLCEKYATTDVGDLPSSLEIRPADARMKGFDLWFKDEDHTLGNLLDTWIDETLIGSEVGRGIQSVGYKVPHPLRNDMVLRIGIENSEKSVDDESIVRKALADAARGCAELFRTYANDWFLLTGTMKEQTTAKEQTTPTSKTTWEAHKDAKQKK
jgi:DNA-directed RNA polymerase subunit L